MYILIKQIKEKDRQKHLLILLKQRLSEEDRNQLLKKEKYFKCHEFKHLITDCTAKKQNISNVIKKNNIKLVIKKKTEKKHKSSSVNDSNESEN